VASDCRNCNNYRFRRGKPHCPFGMFVLDCDHFEDRQEVFHAISVDGLDIPKFLKKLDSMKGSKDEE
jgi:hypothetical protein